VHSVIRDHLGDYPAERIRVAYGRASGENWRDLGRRGWCMHSMGAMMSQMKDGAAVMCSVPHMSQGPRAWPSDGLMEVWLQMADKSSLNFALAAVPVQLALLACAAERLGTEVDAPVLAEKGPQRLPSMTCNVDWDALFGTASRCWPRCPTF
jgi:hypothetical protein